MDIVNICLKIGAAKAEEIPITSIELVPELRELCEQNVCARYGSNYTCPPHIGKVNALIEKLKTYNNAVIWQNIYALEDSFDIEGMMEAQKKHNEQTMQIAKQVYSELGRENTLVLAAGGCVLCKQCAVQTGEPCRNPDEALSSLEAYGIQVSKTCEALSMNYINGKDTVTYFSGIFYR